jgi:hypothetical protein
VQAREHGGDEKHQMASTRESVESMGIGEQSSGVGLLFGSLCFVFIASSGAYLRSSPSPLLSLQCRVHMEG